MTNLDKAQKNLWIRIHPCSVGQPLQPSMVCYFSSPQVECDPAVGSLLFFPVYSSSVNLSSQHAVVLWKISLVDCYHNAEVGIAAFGVVVFVCVAYLVCTYLKLSICSTKVWYLWHNTDKLEWGLIRGDNGWNLHIILYSNYSHWLWVWLMAATLTWTSFTLKRNGNKMKKYPRMYLWWSLHTLCLHTVQLRVTVGDSGLVVFVLRILSAN